VGLLHLNINSTGTYFSPSQALVAGHAVTKRVQQHFHLQVSELHSGMGLVLLKCPFKRESTVWWLGFWTVERFGYISRGVLEKDIS
jgi:hypothetical protein